MFIIIILLILNIILFHSAFLGVILGAIYFFVYGKKLGRWLFAESAVPDGDCGEKYSAALGIFFLLSFFSLAGALIYYLYKLNNIIIILLLLAAPYIINKLYKKWPISVNASAQDAAHKYLKWIRRLFFVIFNWGNLKKIFRNKIRGFIISLEFLYLLIFGALLVILYKSSTATATATRSPWLVIPKYFFILYIFATILLIAIIQKRKKTSLPFIILHFFLSSSVALIVYKLGYGFDPFIHQATEKVIFEKGIITPKPFYYLGQYSLVVILAKISQISVSAIDKLLVPVMFSVFVPIFVFMGFFNVFYRRRQLELSPTMKDIKYTELSILALLILPFSTFIATTPQGLANIYALVVIFLAFTPFSKGGRLPAGQMGGFSRAPASLDSSSSNTSDISKGKIPPTPLLKKGGALIFLATATLAIHPLTGIPVAIFVGVFLFLRRRDGASARLRHSGGCPVSAKEILPLFLIIGVSSIIIPLSFYVNSIISKASQVSILSAVEVQNVEILQTRQYHFIRDFIYLYGFNIVLIFLIISLIGAVILNPAFCGTKPAQMLQAGENPVANGKNQIKRWLSGLSTPLPCLLTFLVLLINCLFLKNFVKFNSLIYYEQGDYAQRLLMLSLYFLLPFFLYAFYWFFEKLWTYISFKSHSVIPSEVSLQCSAERRSRGIPLFIGKFIRSKEIPPLPLDSPVPQYYGTGSLGVGRDDRAGLRLCNVYTKYFFLTLFALWITASLYLTYPRYDNYVSSHGFNVSESDFKAVVYIHKNATSENYIVLANQNTSAAALAKYGFLKYYCKDLINRDAINRVSTRGECENQIFYYPIPTSSPLYEYYLSMVNTKPSRKTMQGAMDYAGADEAYFVVSDYWWRADQIIENAKLEADGWEQIDGGKACIFKYLK